MKTWKEDNMLLKEGLGNLRSRRDSDDSFNLDATISEHVINKLNYIFKKYKYNFSLKIIKDTNTQGLAGKTVVKLYCGTSPFGVFGTLEEFLHNEHYIQDIENTLITYLYKKSYDKVMKNIRSDEKLNIKYLNKIEDIIKDIKEFIEYIDREVGGYFY